MSAPAAVDPRRHPLGGSSALAGLDLAEQLGRGAHATVYRARKDGREYAVKVLRADVLDRDAAASAFQREAALLACVDHPSVARVHDVGDLDGDPFIVMELVEGRPLAALLDEGPLAPIEAVRTVAGLAAALAAVHRVGVVHRDVTPRNIVVLADGCPKLVDFGLASQAQLDAGQARAAGTFAYAAPEQTGMLARPVDGRADLYALGVVLFECLTGRRPFESADVGELVRLHAVAPVPDVRSLNPQVPVALAAIVTRLLAKDPDDRYADGDELAAALNGLLDAPAEQRGGDTGGRLVGRAAELTTLTERWARARAGAAGAVRLTGAPGVGKTRLADELARRVRIDGSPVLTLLCSPGAPLLAPLRAALERYLLQLERLPEAVADAVREQVRAAAGPGAAVLQLLSPALRDVLRAPELADDDRQDQLVTAAAAFLAGLSDGAGGLLLHIDDAQWLDEGTAQVLTTVYATEPAAGLLTVTTERPDTAPPWLRALPGPAVEVPPFGDADMTALVSAQLGNVAVPPQIVDQLTARSGGNPFAAVQYLRTMLDAAVLLPRWGTWRLDERGLDRLALPTDVVELVVARTRALPGASRELLVAAAAVGAPFAADLPADVCRTELAAALTAVQDGVAAGVLEAADKGRYAFLHQRLREALLDGLDPAARRELHQRIAECLHTTDRTDPRDWYRIARHYAEGVSGRSPQPMVTACRSAAAAALAAQAPQQALDFLQLAEDTAAAAGLPLDGAFHHQRGLACLRTGRFADAERALEVALRIETDPLRRAELLTQVAHAQNSDYASDESLRTVRAGLSELGRAVPRNPMLFLLTSLLYFLAGVVIGRSRRWAGTATGAERERERLHAELCDAGAMAAAVGMRKALIPLFHLRAVPSVNRLGAGPEYARLQAAFGMIADAAYLKGLANRCYARAAAAARRTGDPRLTTRVPWSRATGEDSVAGFKGDTGGALRDVLREHGPWLPVGEYMSSIGGLGSVLVLRGYTREAESWYERARSRMTGGVVVPGNPVATLGVQVAATTGRRAEAQARLDAMTAAAGARGDNPGRYLNILLARACLAVEAVDADEVDALVAEVHRRRITPRTVWPQQRHLWLYLAWARLAQCRAAGPERRVDRLSDARRAVAALGRAADTEVLRAFHKAALAEYLELAGHPERALRHLAGAELLRQRLDLPLLGHRVAVTRSRALRALGHPAEAERQAQLGVLLATEYGWEHHARTARALLDGTSPAAVPDGRSSGATNAGGALIRRRLAALQELSAAAATVLDPDELARVALDETIRTFAAERAILFLHDEDTDRLEPHLGRESGGAELTELRGYGASLVEQVRHSGAAIVLASTDDGAALGSRSVVANGLRSVMIAPLRLRGDVLGAVYLDTRLVKGAFTADDADVLTAITQHIAGALVTARAAQLEVTVRTVERQRTLADTMRAAVSDVSGTLVPQDVLDRLLDTFVRVTGADSGVLIPVAEVAIPAHRTADPELLPAFASLDVARRGAADGLWAALTGVLPSARSWIATPLIGSDGRVAVALLAAADPHRFDDSHVSILAALAEQGMVAYQNARLFAQVELLATTDVLTGTHNRRHFFDVAAAEVARAHREPAPLSAVMIDIDHFKRINDNHGHGTGDDVIQQVAARVRHIVDELGLLGRYGGEEFAVVLPGHDAAAAWAVGEALRRSVAAEPVGTRTGAVPVSVSVGVADLGGAGDGLDEVLGRADEALYRAKQAGRNRVVRHSA